MKTQQPLTRRRVAVIGAGVAGIATAKCLMDEGHEPVVFERTDKIGGIWVFGQDRLGGVYASTVYQNTKYVSCFSDFPMSREVSVFPRHDEILSYLLSYADHFGVTPRIVFGTSVVHAEPDPDGGWTLRIAGKHGERVERFDAIAVCTGTYGRPRMPQVPGMDGYRGTLMHSARYKTNDFLAGKRVVVVGGGVSGMDIAVDASKRAQATYWSVRGRHWIRPRWFGYVPYEAGVVPGVRVSREQMLAHWRQWIPAFHAKMAKTGWIPQKDPFGEGFGASDEILDCLLDGSVVECAALASFEPDAVCFQDGSRVEADAVVFATGYESYAFPFFDEGLRQTLGVHDEGIDLYREVFHPRVPNCAFMFHVAGNAPAMPTVELQARWFAMLLSGHRALPSPEDMDRWIGEDRAWRRQHCNKTSYRANFVDGRYVQALAEYIGVLPDKRTHWNEHFELVKPPSFPHIFRMHGPGRQDEAGVLLAQARAAYPVKAESQPRLKQQLLAQMSRQDLVAMYCRRQISRQDIVEALLDQGSSKPGAAAPVRALEGVLLPLKEAGHGAPLFLFHAVGGSAYGYVPVARALARLRPEQKLYGVQSVGLFGPDEPLQSVEAMARCYADELLRVQPEGPFHLGGWSFGGVLAFEVAAQLEGRGHRVAVVLLLDSYIHTGEKSYLAGHDRRSLFAVYLGMLAAQKGQCFAEPAGEDAAFPALLRQGRDQGLLPPDMDEVAVDRLLQVYRLNIAAFEAYRPGMVQSPLAALVCTDHSAIGSEREALEWGRRTQGRFDARPIEGGHDDIMAADRAHELCAWMLPYLPEAKAQEKALAN